MSDVMDLDTNEQEHTDIDVDKKENDCSSTEINEEEIIKKKYGGILPKKPPLISKDHERAFFDSADWALGKQGAQGDHKKGPLEALRPKLQMRITEPSLGGTMHLLAVLAHTSACAYMQQALVFDIFLPITPKM